jgi:hypothetical protein
LRSNLWPHESVLAPNEEDYGKHAAMPHMQREVCQLHFTRNSKVPVIEAEQLIKE